MSLINRMLLDLEQRQSMAGADPVLAGLSSVDYCARETHRFRHASRALLVLTIVVALAALFYAAMSLRPFYPAGAQIGAKSFPPVQHAATPRSGSITPAAHGSAVVDRTPAIVAPPRFSLKFDETLSSLARSAATAPAPTPVRNEAENPPLAEVFGIDVTPRGDRVDVKIALNGAAKYVAYPLAAPDRLVVEIAGARLGDHVQRSFDTGPVRRLRARNERGQAVLVFDLDRPARIETSEPEASAAAPNLLVTLAMSPDYVAPGTPSAIDAVSDAAPGPPDVVTPEIPGSMEIQPYRNHRAVDRLYQEAAQMFRDGELAAGLAKLAEVLTQDPGHVNGRRLLATELMQQGDPRQAAAILDAGLQSFPRTWQWAQLRAQIAVNSGETERALEVLSVAPPAVTDQPEYHALLAAVQQRAGRHAEAINTYHSILGRQPERGLWWMGLGISLQALQRTREAGFAYSRAMEDSSLTPELRSFVQGRMTTLPPGGDT